MTRVQLFLIVIIVVFGIGARTCVGQHEDCSNARCLPGLTCLSYSDGSGAAVETCEIPCADDVDCPALQWCAHQEPGPGDVCEECLGVGEMAAHPEACCPGLQAMSACIPGEQCDSESYYCTDCGNGTCDPHETPWECARDCGSCEGLDLSDEECATKTVQFWVNEQQRQTASALAKMSFEERAESIHDHAWSGDMPGSVVTGFHLDGAIDRLWGIELAPEQLGLAGDSAPLDVAKQFESLYAELLLDVETDSLHEPEERYLEATDQTVVHFYQSFDDLFVVGGVLILIIDSEGTIRQISNSTIGGIPTTQPEIELEDVARTLSRHLGTSVGVVQSALNLYRDPRDRSGSILAYDVAVSNLETGAELGAFQIDALTGDIIKKHDEHWRSPTPPGTHKSGGNPVVHAYSLYYPYEEAYDCLVDNPDCEYGFFKYSAQSVFPNYPPGATVLNIGSASLIWADGAPTSAWQAWRDDPTLGATLHLIWNIFQDEYPNNQNDILGSPLDPFRIYFRSQMYGVTVGYCLASGGACPLVLVEGAGDVGTLAHEFGHRVVTVHILLEPNSTFDEAQADAHDMIFSQLYHQEMYSDPNAPDVLCLDATGYPISWDKSAGHSCFNVLDSDGLVKHHVIDVHKVGTETRCSAIEELDLQDPDANENIWRSFKNPQNKNHGHGRGAATFDQITNQSSKVFDRAIVEQALNHNLADVGDHFCPSSSGLCQCGDFVGSSHTNQGVHNRFFFNLSQMGGSNPLGTTLETAAQAQKDLLYTVYQSVAMESYTQWAEQILIAAESMSNFSEIQKTNVRSALNNTRVYHSVGSEPGVESSDFEAVWYWTNVDDQRLYLFHRQPESFGDPGQDAQRYARPLYYSVYQMSGASDDWVLAEDCEMPPIVLSGTNEQIAPISGFAPTAVQLDERIFVAWNQFDQETTGDPLGSKGGHLSYATLLPSGGSDACGSWSEVIYDAETTVYGSPRSTVIERGAIVGNPMDLEFEYNCLPPGCDSAELFQELWYALDPAGPVTLTMLEKLGFTPDQPMDEAWAGHPGYEGILTAGEAVGRELPELVPYAAGDEEVPDDAIHRAVVGIKGVLQTPELGVSSEPVAVDPRAPAEAKHDFKLVTRRLNRAISAATKTHPELVENIAEYYPNAVQFINHMRDEPSAIALEMVAWTPDLPGPFYDIEVALINVTTVAVAFLDSDPDGAALPNVVVRQYGASEDPLETVDTAIGQARYVPGLATLGPGSMPTVEGADNGTRLIRDNVIACTSFVYDGMPLNQTGRMSCKIFEHARLDLPGTLHKIKPADERVETGARIEIHAAPRGVNVRDIAYILFRDAANNVNYVAFRGIEFEPVTYRPVFSGLEFPSSFDGPSRFVGEVRTDEILRPLPQKSGDPWPVFPGSWIATEYGALGYVALQQQNIAVTPELHIFARGPNNPLYNP